MAKRKLTAEEKAQRARDDARAAAIMARVESEMDRLAAQRADAEHERR